MQFTLHATRRTPHGALRLVHKTPAWSVKTRRAPSWHCRDAGVYGLTNYGHPRQRIPQPPAPPPSSHYVHLLLRPIQRALSMQATIWRFFRVKIIGATTLHGGSGKQFSGLLIY